MLSRRFESGWEALLKVRDWSGGPHGSPGVVGMPSQRYGKPSRITRNGHETITEDQERTGGLPEGPGLVGRPSRRYRSGREALPEVLE